MRGFMPALACARVSVTSLEAQAIRSGFETNDFAGIDDGSLGPTPAAPLGTLTPSAITGGSLVMWGAVQ